MKRSSFRSARGIVAAKLGRCTDCMRAARNGTIASWSIVGLLFVFWSHPLAVGLAAFVATCFTLLMVLHTAAYAWHEQEELRRIRRTRARYAQADPARRRFLGMTLSATGALALASLVDFGRAIPAAAHIQICPPKCSCYFSSNCTSTGRGTTCDYIGFSGGCTMRAKPNETINGQFICGNPESGGQCDGVCKGNRASGATWLDIDPNLIAGTANLYLLAYQRGAEMGGGPPDEALLAEALSAPLPTAWHLELVRATHNYYDVLIGSDFLRPSILHFHCFGEITVLVSNILELLDVTRQAFVEGLRVGNAAMVVDPISAFWRAGSDYHPLHWGRCYPHGHPEVTAPAPCQARELRGLLNVLLRGRRLTAPGSDVSRA